MPRVHAHHGGPFWRPNDFNVWHGITILGKDRETGNDVSVFWVPLSQGWVQAERRPLQNALFSFHDVPRRHLSGPADAGYSRARIGGGACVGRRARGPHDAMEEVDKHMDDSRARCTAEVSAAPPAVRGPFP